MSTLFDEFESTQTQTPVAVAFTKKSDRLTFGSQSADSLIVRDIKCAL
jgi:hypothetical protein